MVAASWVGRALADAAVCLARRRDARPSCGRRAALPASHRAEWWHLRTAAFFPDGSRSTEEAVVRPQLAPAPVGGICLGPRSFRGHRRGAAGASLSHVHLAGAVL